jgi:hypothetical protein
LQYGIFLLSLLNNLKYFLKKISILHKNPILLHFKKRVEGYFMKQKANIVFSLLTALVLATGCGSSGGSDKKMDIEDKGASGIQSDPVGKITSNNPVVSQIFSQPADMAMDVTVQKDILHLVDGDLLHLVADPAQMGIKGMVVSYQWTDNNGSVLSQTGLLEQTVHYDPLLDDDQDGVSVYTKTLTLIDMFGSTVSKAYTIFVHQRALEGGQALLGPLSQAHYKLTKLHHSEAIVEGTTTQGDGEDVTTAGIIPLSAKLLNSLESGYYLLTVSGGEDIDRNDDLIWDETPTPVSGGLHAIVTKEELQTGHYKVNIFTQVIYDYLAGVENLAQMSDAKLAQRVDALAKELIKRDVNGDGARDYQDILYWNPVTDKDKLTIDYDKKVEPYVEQVLYKKGLEELSLDVTRYVVSKKIMANEEITYLYDSHGNMIEKRIKETGNPDIVSITYTNKYDEQGRLSEQIQDDTQVATRWIYDSSSNVTEKQVGIYDEAGNYAIFERYHFKNGKLDSGRIDRGEFPKYIYYETDQYGNVTKETVKWFGQTFVTQYSYTYDELGHVLKKYENGELLFEQIWRVF